MAFIEGPSKILNEIALKGKGLLNMDMKKTPKGVNNLKQIWTHSC